MSKHLFELILSIKRKCQANEDRISNDLGLSQAEFNGLIVLQPNEEIFAGQFAERMGLSPSRGSRVLTKLMNSGFVDSSLKPGDRRSVAIRLTDTGITMKKKLQQRMMQCEDRICSGFDECRIDEIKEVLIALDAAL